MRVTVGCLPANVHFPTPPRVAWSPVGGLLAAVGGVAGEGRGFVRVWDDRGLAVAATTVPKDMGCCLCTSWAKGTSADR